MDHPVRNRTIPHGAMPDCVECGECFSNWDRILEDLRTKTQNTVGKAVRVKVRPKLIIELIWFHLNIQSSYKNPK